MGPEARQVSRRSTQRRAASKLDHSNWKVSSAAAAASIGPTVSAVSSKRFQAFSNSVRAATGFSEIAAAPDQSASQGESEEAPLAGNAAIQRRTVLTSPCASN